MTPPSSWLQLANKTAVVTGAASGIGAAVSRALAREDCHVILVDRDQDRLQEIQSKHAENSTSYCCNVANEADVRELFQSLSSHHKQDLAPATILVNCAGITRDGWIGRMSLEQWQQVQDVNLTGTFLTCREFLQQPSLLLPDKKIPASIVNVSSVVATQGNLGQVNYAASKGGVISLTKALAKEVAPRNVRVNCVLPGFIETEMTKAVPEKVKEPIKQKIVWQQRFGQPDDIANLILFLASDVRSGYITGESIECSGMIAL